MSLSCCNFDILCTCSQNYYIGYVRSGFPRMTYGGAFREGRFHLNFRLAAWISTINMPFPLNTKQRREFICSWVLFLERIGPIHEIFVNLWLVLLINHPFAINLVRIHKCCIKLGFDHKNPCMFINGNVLQIGSVLPKHINKERQRWRHFFVCFCYADESNFNWSWANSKYFILQY